MGRKGREMGGWEIESGTPYLFIHHRHHHNQRLTGI